MRWYWILILVLGNNVIWGQDFMLMDSIYPNESVVRGYYFDLQTCELNYGGTQVGYNVTGFTPHGNGTVYGYAIDREPNNSLTWTGLKRYISGTLFLGAFPIADFGFDTTIMALGTDLDSIVYGAGESLWMYDPSTGVEALIGDFPTNMQCSGGMTLREGQLYMTSINHDLVRLDIDDPMNSTIIYSFPDTLPPISAMVTVPYACDSIVTYVYSGRIEEPTQMYALDFDDFSLEEVCEIERHIIAAANYAEISIPSCNMYIDLDMDNSTASGVDYLSDTACATPLTITDIDLDVFSQIDIDSITISLQGILDIGNEYIEGQASVNIDVINNGTEAVTLVNTGGASMTDFTNALQSILYYNTASNFAYGQRSIEFILHALYYRSEPSTAYITLGNVTIGLAEEITPPCYDEDNGMVIMDGLGGTSPYQFTLNGQVVDTLQGISAGIYPILVTDALGCKGEDTILVVANDSLYANFEVPLDSICGSIGSLIALPEGGTSPYTIEWDGGASTDTLSGLAVGTYMLTLTDALGCTAEAAYTLYPADTIYTYGEETACEGNSIIWQGEEYTSDTTICITTTSFYGCDSIHCVDLIFQDSFYQEENFTLCLGEELSWQGTSYYQDTSVCVIYVNEAGCDSTYCMNASFISRVNTIEASICEGDIFLFNGQSLTQAGTYTDIISDGGVCDSLIVLELESYPLPSVGINADGNLCTGAQVGLNAEGTGVYEWSTGEVSNVIEVQEEGWYYLTLTDNNDCEAIDSILLSEGSPDLSYVITPANCPDFPNGSIQIDSVWGGNPPYLYAINESPLQGQDSFTGLEAGSYTLIVEDIDGCLRSYNVMIESASNHTFSLGDDIKLSLGDSIALTPFINTTSGNLSIQWQPTDYLNCDSCIAPITKPFRTITYQAFLTDDFGCTLSDDITIVVSQKEGLFIPNAFSPNGDGRNDRLVLFSDASILTIDRFQIFDRWGSLVFERKDFLPNVDDGLNWEGMIKGQLAPIEAYTYVTVFKTVAGEEHVVSGIVNLLR